MTKDRKNPASREAPPELDIETSQELQWALTGRKGFGTRNYALDFWQQIAAGRHDQETRIFIETVAHDLVQAEKFTQRKRHDEIIKAVRLTGDTQRDKIETTDDAEREIMMNDFPNPTKQA